MGVLAMAKARQRVLRGHAGCAVALVGWARTFLTSCRPKILFTVHVESALTTHIQRTALVEALEARPRARMPLPGRLRWIQSPVLSTWSTGVKGCRVIDARGGQQGEGEGEVCVEVIAAGTSQQSY